MFLEACAKVESGVRTYLSKQSEDQRPRALMSQVGTLAAAAAVAAPMRKLCPANSCSSRPPLLSKNLTSRVNSCCESDFPDLYMKRGPLAVPLMAKYSLSAVTGQIS